MDTYNNDDEVTLVTPRPKLPLAERLKTVNESTFVALFTGVSLFAIVVWMLLR